MTATYGPAPRIAIFLNGKPSKTWFPKKKKKKDLLKCRVFRIGLHKYFPSCENFFFYPTVNYNLIL